MVWNLTQIEFIIPITSLHVHKKEWGKMSKYETILIIYHVFLRFVETVHALNKCWFLGLLVAVYDETKYKTHAW